MYLANTSLFAGGRGLLGHALMSGKRNPNVTSETPGNAS